MKGILVVNGYYKTDASVWQAERIKEELIIRGAAVTVYENNRPVLTGEDFDCDFGVFFDKDVHLAEILEASGLRLFNSAFSIAKTDNKLTAAAELKRRGFEIPSTIPAPKQYKYALDEKFLREAGEILGYPLIVKEAYGSLGEQVYLARDLTELTKIDAELSGRERLYQTFVGESAGKSIRALVVGGKLICAFKLVNDGDFRSNGARGGRAEGVELNAESVRIAERAAQEFALDYCGVDLFADGKTVIEINSNAYFKTAESCTGCNVAGAFADYIIKTMGEKKVWKRLHRQ